ncbi:ATP-binding protein [Modicisalibacter tunisiensis]|uniref:histidine kinase n=1 Tax=Modicisalibacter tunisiensis TaxID=390637 RepID=A0ABS7X529_9GAMM|nr:ATP-binding protein [Modicisalibacter tunisiensis]KXS36701.1 MAG: periplasmic sensor signal transduction histidine kinase [Halomonadaceae bacterium T82-2]MBZ9537337.1 sensor histidine kinase N-terminal domain-containing protein [Modicisalibacter tunisiensis]MBZ9569241.1 sensor histidine kinase N-terminal domain-containing protein [Modicisalibacter tunisiensis]
MSLRLRLVVTLGVTLLALWGITAAWLIRDLSTQFEQSLDQRLAQSARMVAGLMDRVPVDAWRGDTGALPVIPDLEGVACRVSSLRGQVVAGTHPELNDVLAASAEGYGYRRHDGQRWRVYTLIDENRRITVADRMRERESLLTQVRRAAFYPFLLALTGSLVALWWGVTRGLAPLARLQRRLVQRDHDDLSALPTRGLPGEIRPLIDGFNSLLARTRRMLEREQRFTDDAAHELRTPLTAVRTHLQVARRVDGERHREAMQQAEAGVVRLTRTLEQLLLLARMDNDVGRGDLEPARLGEALEAAMAETHSHDRCRLAGVDASLRIAMPVTLLATALRNLIENAQHHGEPGHPIEIGARRGDSGVVIEVINQGDVIPPTRLANLTDRFYRGNHPRGSGLGLAIVKALAERFGGALTLASSTETPFLVRLRLPQAHD